MPSIAGQTRFSHKPLLDAAQYLNFLVHFIPSSHMKRLFAVVELQFPVH